MFPSSMRINRQDIPSHNLNQEENNDAGIGDT